jgi:hypothetical protein
MAACVTCGKEKSAKYSVCFACLLATAHRGPSPYKPGSPADEARRRLAAGRKPSRTFKGPPAGVTAPPPPSIPITATPLPPRPRKSSPLRFDAGASMLGDVAATDVRLNLVSDTANSYRFGLEVLCAAPVPCACPETCFHVRAALHRRADAAPIATLVTEAALHGRPDANVRVRLPLADRLWVTAVIPLAVVDIERPPRIADAVIATFFEVVPFEYGNHGSDDLKWAFVNYAARKLDEFRHNYGHTFQCNDCSQILPAHITDERDFAWTLTWATWLRTARMGDHPTCPDCVRRRATVRYNRRASLDFTMMPDNPDW